MPGYLFEEGDELSSGQLVQLPRVLHLVQLPVQVLNLSNEKIKEANYEEDIKKVDSAPPPSAARETSWGCSTASAACTRPLDAGSPCRSAGTQAAPEMTKIVF